MKRKDRNTYSKSFSVALFGARGTLVEIECQQSMQLPGFSVVGMNAAAARETKERVLGAIHASGIKLPSRRIVINLSQSCKADTRAFDLPIAMACLAAAEVVSQDALAECAFLGELTLAGQIRPARAAAALPRLLRERKLRAACVARESASFTQGTDPKRGGGFATLADLVRALKQGEAGYTGKPLVLHAARAPAIPLDAIRGHAPAKCLLAIAAAGAHHALFSGPRGAGKSLLASALPGLLPKAEPALAEEIEAVHRLAGLEWDGARPFRYPHASVTGAGLLGGGGGCVPGELSLAHGGVIFLDELLEFRREVLESLRVALESGEIALARSENRTVLPARAQLIAATNLCPCGVAGDARGECRCRSDELRAYQRRLSHSLRDRIDLRMAFLANVEGEVAPATTADPAPIPVWTLDSVEKRVSSARETMIQRQGKPNAELSGIEVFAITGWKDAVRRDAENVARELALSSRGLVSLARVARTIADLADRECVEKLDIREAKSYLGDPFPPTFECAPPKPEWRRPFSPAVPETG